MKQITMHFFSVPKAKGLSGAQRAAVMLLAPLLLTMTAQTAWATTPSAITVGGTDYTLFTGFTATGGNGTNYAKLVDGNTSTDWIATKSFGEATNHFNGGTDDPAFVEFHADEPIVPKGYVLTCDHENAGFWKPVEWALKAKLNEGDEWTTIHSSNTTLGAGKTFEIPCINDDNNEYQYFRFEVYEVGTTMIVDLDELQIYGKFTYTPVSARAATCTEYGLTNDGYQRSDGKYFSDENGTNELTVGNGLIDKIPHTGVHHEASDSNIEYWQCSMCGKYFSDSGCTNEISEAETLIGVFGAIADGRYTLTSQTYTLTGDENTAGYIYVPSGVTATIDLNGHTIDRGLTSEMTNGSVIIVEGTLTITDSSTGGTVQGGYDAGDGYGYTTSCVKVLEGATFNLQGGTLIGIVQDYDYTVSVVDNSNFTMTGGKITGGWTGVLAVGNVTLTGGEISGNSNSGVRVGDNFSISGNPVITENTEMNVDLVSSYRKKIIITGALNEGANIGITAPTPTDNAPVTVTSGYGTHNSEPVSTYFSLDNGGKKQTSPVDYMTVVMGWNEDRTEVAVGTALYTVNFDMNGHGDAIDAVSLLSGYKVAQPTEPTADDRFFVDWFTDDACTTGNEWNFDNAVTSNMTLHAKWTQTAIHSINLPENMVIVSTDKEAVGGKYPVGTVIKFKLSSADYVIEGDVKNGEEVLSADANGIYTITMGDADLAITATVKKAVEPNKTLSGSDNYTAQGGNVLTGSTSGTVTIANNAKITLSDVTITGGIVCEGTAEITLVGTNSVTGINYQSAGIQIGGSGTTLTINGNGSLTANGGDQSAGIGLSRAWDVDNTGGNIVIEGGNITATGGSMGAGIGLGVAYDNSPRTITLGNITIKGGSVTATGGGNQGNGIGTGYVYGLQNASNIGVGTITITTGIDRVEASSISKSVTYKHGDTDVTSNASDYFAINGTTITLREYTITYNLNDGTNATGNPATYNLKTETFTLADPSREGYEFAGWFDNDGFTGDAVTTIAQGSTGDKTFYAKWKKLLTNTDITISIPSQEWTGSEVTFDASTVVVKDGETTLAMTTDYTVTAPSGTIQNAGDYTYTITGAGNYSGEATATFTIMPKAVGTYGALAVTEDQNGKTATIDASLEATIEITSDVEINQVELQRSFTANQPATVMLPFSLGDGQAVNGGSFYKFSGVTKDGDVWKALFTVVATLKANTPYLFMPSATGQMTFDLNGGTVTLNTTTTGEAGSTASNWEFRGTYAKVQWAGTDSDPSDLSKTYGFAKGNATIAAGQFVHFAAGAWLKPMRCYLVYNGSTEGGTFQNARSMTRGAASTEELPQTITVVLLSSSGETTGIGTLDTKTGDITLDGWYTMDGRKLEGKPTKKGLYINNGRKIVIK